MSTAYWSTERKLRSVWTTTLATFRCTKTSPGASPTIWFAGTRLSEQPTHRYSGVCRSARSVKNPGSPATIAAAHARFRSNSSWSPVTGGLPPFLPGGNGLLQRRGEAVDDPGQLALGDDERRRHLQRHPAKEPREDAVPPGREDDCCARRRVLGEQRGVELDRP